MPRWGCKALVASVVLGLVGFAGWHLGLRLWGAHHLRLASEALERRDFKEARRHFDTCLELWPGDLTIRLSAARAARRDGNVSAAVDYLLGVRAKEFLEAVELERKLVRVQRGDLREADALMQACVADPGTPEATLILEAVIEGSHKIIPVALAMGLPADNAMMAPEIARLRLAVDLWLPAHPNHADQVEGLVWRGQLHNYESEHEQAVADLRQAVAMDPEHFNARWHLVKTVGQEAPEEVARHLETLCKQQPDNKLVHVTLAGVRRTLGRVAEARRQLDDILDSSPDYLPALLERGQLAVDEQQPDEAEQFLRRAEALAPRDRDVNVALSRCLYLAGRFEEAKRYHEEYRRIDAAHDKMAENLIKQSKLAAKGQRHKP